MRNKTKLRSPVESWAASTKRSLEHLHPKVETPEKKTMIISPPSFNLLLMIDLISTISSIKKANLQLLILSFFLVMCIVGIQLVKKGLNAWQLPTTEEHTVGKQKDSLLDQSLTASLSPCTATSLHLVFFFFLYGCIMSI